VYICDTPFVNLCKRKQNFESRKIIPLINPTKRKEREKTKNILSYEKNIKDRSGFLKKRIERTAFFIAYEK